MNKSSGKRYLFTVRHLKDCCFWFFWLCVYVALFRLFTYLLGGVVDVFRSAPAEVFVCVFAALIPFIFLFYRFLRGY